jgi:hypothetical protein
MYSGSPCASRNKPFGPLVCGTPALCSIPSGVFTSILLHTVVVLSHLFPSSVLARFPRESISLLGGPGAVVIFFASQSFVEIFFSGQMRHPLDARRLSR